MFKKFWRRNIRLEKGPKFHDNISAGPLDLEKSSELFNEIGVAAVQQIGDVATKILVYAERGEDSLSVFVRHAMTESTVVDSLDQDRPVIDAIWALLSYLETVGEEHLWKSMEYVVDYGSMDVALLYEKPFAGNELALWEKSSKLLEKHFPGKPHR